MFESEVNSLRESSATIPAEVLKRFSELKSLVVARTVLNWSEHCTECVWPTCYQSCDLYEPRVDGKCRRFADGMVRVDNVDGVNPYLLKISFKRWAKLYSQGNVFLYSPKEAASLERRDRLVGAVLRNLPLPRSRRLKLASKRYKAKRDRTDALAASPSDRADALVLEAYNPQPDAVSMTVSVRPQSKERPIAFQSLAHLKQGYNRVQIPVELISQLVDLSQPFTVDLVLNDAEEGTTLYFGLTEFVQLAAVTKSEKTPGGVKSCKCVVWDLDNTLWSGTLVEDGLAGISLKPGVVEIITELDRRGILQSVASKNNPEEALEALKKFGIHDFFLHPQVSWGPKSSAVREIASQLNIGLDTFLFVDDQPFERAQVESALPAVRVVDAVEYARLLEHPACQVEVTDEGSQRRQLYQKEAVRKGIQQSFDNDYFGFLRHCEIKLRLGRLTDETLQRVHELTQRTNQMNFSGNRYNIERLRQIMEDVNLDTYVLECVDRFGSYGTVGFSVIDRREPRMIDLMFSCRIQSKRVEHAFLTAVLKRHRLQGGGDFFADYRRTDRNAPSGAVFTDFGFAEQEIVDGVTKLLFPIDREVLDDSVIEVLDLNSAEITQ